MNREMLLTTLKDATSHLTMAEEIVKNLPPKEKANAYIEMAKGYALASIASALAVESIQAPETVAASKKQKEEKSAIEEVTEQIAQQTKEVQEKVQEAQEATQKEEIQEAPATAVIPEMPPEETEEPLIQIVDDVFIQFTKPVIEEDYDYSAWLMDYVNAVDDEGNVLVGASWANDFVVAFSNGLSQTVEDINEDSVMGYIHFIIDSIDAANTQA